MADFLGTMSINRRVVSCLKGASTLLIGLGLVGCNSGSLLKSRAAEQPEDSDWPGYGGPSGENHFSRLAEIDSDSVSRLGLAWSLDLPAGNAVSQPIAVNGIVYVATGYSLVRAIDGVSGKEVWHYDPQVAKTAHGPEKMQYGWGIRGLAYLDGKLFVGTQDGRLIALSASDGALAWSVQSTDPDDASFISGAPRVAKGLVFIGNGGADSGKMRGYVTAYDANTGKQAWRFYTVPGDPSKGFENDAMKLAARTWTGAWWKFGGGGTVWNAMTYDPETDTLFVGTGNGTPWNRHIRSPSGGDNLFLCSIVALDARTGKYKWHYQVNPGESWDYNAAMDLPLATLRIDGKPRHVIMQAPKNGFFYVIDRETGKLISARPFEKVTWASGIDPASGRPLENPAARFPDGSTFTLWPSSMGAHNWYPMAHSPASGLVYIPTIHSGATVTDRDIDVKGWKPSDTNKYGLMLGVADSVSSGSHLVAWNPVTQSAAWTVATTGVAGGGTMATAGGLVFQGEVNGRFNAYAAASGRKLWSFDARAPVVAPPMTFWAKGRQYVTVLSGLSTSAGAFGSQMQGFGWRWETQSRRVLTFALDARGVLPAAIRSAPLQAPRDDSYRPDEALAIRGAILFHEMTCAGCHGITAISGGGAPDLRASAIPQSAEAFEAVVRRGALAEQGMPRFTDMNNADLAALRQYLRSRGYEIRSTK